MAGFFSRYALPSVAKNAGKYAEFVEICAKICGIMRYMRALCGIYAEKCESSHIYASVIFEMPKYEEKYAICGFSKNMRYMLRSHDRYKPASLIH